MQSGISRNFLNKKIFRNVVNSWLILFLKTSSKFSIQNKKGVRLINPKPKMGPHGKMHIFLHPNDCGGVLIELEAKN